MSQTLDNSSSNPGENVGASIRLAREKRGWSGAELAAASGVSRAMIDRIERGQSSPTAVLLGRLSAAFGISLSAMLAGLPQPDDGLTRAEAHRSWVDPTTGYVRRQVAASPAFAVDVTEVVLPAGQSVPYPAGAFTFIRQLVWVLEGTLTFTQAGEATELHAGDSFVLGAPVDRVYSNRTAHPCRYVVIVSPH